MIQLPRTFKPTHPTGGLPGYPAIDVFGAPGESVGAPTAGVIRRISGKNPAQGGSPGGAYGWSIYLLAPNGDEYYLTHFGSLGVRVGSQVKRGTILGTICDSAVSGKPNTSHIHEGLKKSTNPIPEPKERLYEVFVGPQHKKLSGKLTKAQIKARMDLWVKRHGEFTVRAVRS